MRRKSALQQKMAVASPEPYGVRRAWWFVWEWRTADWAGAKGGLALGKKGAKWAARSVLRSLRDAEALSRPSSAELQRAASR